MRRLLPLLILAAFLLAPAAALSQSVSWSKPAPSPTRSAMGAGGMGGMNGMSGMNGMGGMRPGGGGGAMPVPEPSALLLFASSMAITAAYFRSLRKRD